ncbi:ATP-binding cassette domain-containing protein [Cytophagales bacterium LB-30]|uniref:ATP-binding cassette domain-containing protein n=1 Tax=Shiella aurantiaca TaxID=3058365 RepID=A0ABT8F4R5_9BACT|nr:ATP-binding cassette domain-containing protein [Shiella aurantiaca]MDN4165437.1 ATP-binding cassette domain-containing protein [Shiella aurantiaca]
MEIIAEGLSKKFNGGWIFKNFTYHFFSGTHYAITGYNGSGKSTLLQLLSGLNLPSKGDISYKHKDKTVSAEQIYQELVFVTPYMELIEEMTLRELITFHFTFKNRAKEFSLDELLTSSGLLHAQDKLIKHFSSGMKQRAQLVLAFASECSLMLLDEPTSNLDAQGVAWYQGLMQQVSNRLVIIASNQPHEYSHAREVINITEWK